MKKYIHVKAHTIFDQNFCAIVATQLKNGLNLASFLFDSSFHEKHIFGMVQTHQLSTWTNMNLHLLLLKSSMLTSKQVSSVTRKKRQISIKVAQKL